MISVIINTAALGPKAQGVLSSGGVPHGERAALLREVIIPTLTRLSFVSEVVVVGEWCDGHGYTYVPSPSVRFDCTDALLQRARGVRATHGRILVFLHDDHLPVGDFFQTLHERYAEDRSWDVLVPERFCEVQNVARVKLNNGAPDYIMGHCCVMRRAAATLVPWDQVPKVFTWDVEHTDQLRQAGAVIRFVDDLQVLDLETRLGAEPWR